MKREILTFHLWFNLAVEDVFLGHLSLFVSVIQTVKPGTSSQTHMRIGKTKWERGKSTNFRASQGFQVFHIHVLYGHSKRNCKLLMCSETNCPWTCN